MKCTVLGEMSIDRIHDGFRIVPRYVDIPADIPVRPSSGSKYILSEADKRYRDKEFAKYAESGVIPFDVYTRVYNFLLNHGTGQHIKT